MTEKTEDQLAAEQAAANAVAEKAEAKRVKDLQKAEEKRIKDEQKAADKAAKAEAKEAAKLAAEEKKAADKAAKEQAKAEAAAAKEASRMPESNGVRRPKPETLCGKAWAIFDDISAANGAPASIAESLTVSNAQGLNEGNVRAEYARWRKFFGVSGRVTAPTAEAPAE